MHYLTLTDKIDLGELQVNAGEYVTDDVTAAHLLVLANGGRMEPVRVSRPIFAEDPPKSVLFSRMGGFGDLVLLTPVLRQIKKLCPETKIAVSTMKDYGAVLANLPFVDEVVPYPLTREATEQYDAWVFLEKAIEGNPEAEKLHMTDLFAKLAGVVLPEGTKRAEYRVKPSEAIWAQEAYPRSETLKRVCIQVGTSSLARTYPRTQMGEVANELLKRGYEVFLMGSKGEIRTTNQLPKHMRNLADADLTFRQSCAVIATADCVIGSDSALVHVAGALEVPAVALYGPFPWKLRTAYAPTTFAIQGNGECAPCFHHVNAARKNHFPENCPSKATGVCAVLADIKPERIVALVEKHAKTTPLPGGFRVIEGGAK